MSLYMAEAELLAGLELAVQLVLVLVQVLQEVRSQGRQGWMRKIGVDHNTNPEAPGVPGSGRNWVLGAVAYIACWPIWIFGVFLGYELMYSFYRRWRFRELYTVRFPDEG